MTPDSLIASLARLAPAAIATVAIATAASAAPEGYTVLFPNATGVSATYSAQRIDPTTCSSSRSAPTGAAAPRATRPRRAGA